MSEATDTKDGLMQILLDIDEMLPENGNTQVYIRVTGEWMAKAFVVVNEARCRLEFLENSTGPEGWQG